MTHTGHLRTEASSMAKTTTRSKQARNAARAVRKQRDEARAMSKANRQAAAKVYIKASKKIGEPVPQKVRDLASGR